MNIGFVLNDTSERTVACLFVIFGDRGSIWQEVHVPSCLTRSYNPLRSLGESAGLLKKKRLEEILLSPEGLLQEYLTTARSVCRERS